MAENVNWVLHAHYEDSLCCCIQLMCKNVLGE